MKKLLYGKRPEWFTLALFAGIYIFITVFHEPWFDEAEAWQIAKCASIQDILFTLPHYEGHPPLWHLILAVPAKLGFPFEIGLKTVGAVISFTAAYILIFHSKLPRLVRLLLPFSYFFFYQYGIIVRPYGLMLVFLLLIGMNLPARKEHPWRVVVLAGCLCMTSAYGILFSGGIALCIVWELWREKGTKGFFKTLLRDTQTRSLLVLLLWTALLIVQIVPDKNAYGTHIQGETTLPLRLFCAFFTFPVECFLSTSSWFGIEQVSMQNMRIPATELIFYSVLGLILWTVIVCASSKKAFKYLFVPYSLYTHFAAAIYFSTHHMGMTFLLILFWAEYISRSEDRFEIGKALLARIANNQRDVKLLKYAFSLVLGASILIPTYWSVSASIHEIGIDYCSARQTANFLLRNHLENATILCQWNDEGSTFPGSEGNEDYINTYVIGTAVPLNAYFPNNIIFNLNNGNDDEAYVHHRIASYEESWQMVEKWSSHGIPDVIIGHPDLKLLYEDSVSYDDYSLVYINKSGFIWKDVMRRGSSLVYVRNDLLQTHGLEALDDPFYIYYFEGIPITDEMKERFYNGESMEEILKPYLDIIFGEA